MIFGKKALALAIAAMLVIAGCSKDDDNKSTPAPQNQSPTASSVISSNTNPAASQTIRLWVFGVSDPDDSLNTLTYAWSTTPSNSGSFRAPTNNDTIYWVAPSSAAVIAVNVTITDPHNNSTTKTISITVASAISANYIGSARCVECHATQAADVEQHGHPYKLSLVTNNTRPVRPGISNEVPAEPATGFSWSDIRYLLGGSTKKARYVTHTGYVVTGSTAQFNLSFSHGAGASGYQRNYAPANHWVQYDRAGTNQASKKFNYACFRCHSTGPDSAGSMFTDPIVRGTFAEPGVNCEACHGPGKAHIENLATHPAGGVSCVSCHVRDDVSGVPVEKIDGDKNFINHHEQKEEVQFSKHSTMTCSQCHYAHKTVVRTANPEAAMKVACTSCHGSVQFNTAFATCTNSCVDCHMSFTDKSAASINAYEGDVRNHMLRVNINSATKIDMWDSVQVGTGYKYFVKTENIGGRELAVGATLDFVCLQCHNARDGAWALSQVGPGTQGVHPGVNAGPSFAKW